MDAVAGEGERGSQSEVEEVMTTEIMPAGIWVVDINNGRVGRTMIGGYAAAIRVNFGSDGPIEIMDVDELRFATNNEIAEKEGRRALKGHQDRNNLAQLKLSDLDALPEHMKARAKERL